MKSQLFTYGGGAGIGSYIIVMKNGEIQNPNAEKIRWSYDSGENLLLSIIDDSTEEALLPLTGYVDNENKLHLVGRDFDDNKTYDFAIDNADQSVHMETIDGITMGDGTIPTEGGGGSSELNTNTYIQLNYGRNSFIGELDGTVIDGRLPFDELVEILQKYNEKPITVYINAGIGSDIYSTSIGYLWFEEATEDSVSFNIESSFGKIEIIISSADGPSVDWSEVVNFAEKAPVLSAVEFEINPPELTLELQSSDIANVVSNHYQYFKVDAGEDIGVSFYKQIEDEDIITYVGILSFQGLNACLSLVFFATGAPDPETGDPTEDPYMESSMILLGQGGGGDVSVYTIDNEISQSDMETIFEETPMIIVWNQAVYLLNFAGDDEIYYGSCDNECIYSLSFKYSAEAEEYEYVDTMFMYNHPYDEAVNMSLEMTQSQLATVFQARPTYINFDETDDNELKTYWTISEEGDDGNETSWICYENIGSTGPRHLTITQINGEDVYYKLEIEGTSVKEVSRIEMAGILTDWSSNTGKYKNRRFGVHLENANDWEDMWYRVATEATSLIFDGYAASTLNYVPLVAGSDPETGNLLLIEGINKTVVVYNGEDPETGDPRAAGNCPDYLAGPLYFEIMLFEHLDE